MSITLLANTTEYRNCSDGDVRLIGGNNDNEGNVQICYNNAWGSVCDDNWNVADSNVVCRQLGLQPYGIGLLLVMYLKIIYNYTSGSMFYHSNYFAVASNPLFVYGTFSCSGSEQSLMACQKSYGNLLNCRNSEIAGVHCEGEILITFSFDWLMYLLTHYKYSDDHSVLSVTFSSLNCF